MNKPNIVFVGHVVIDHNKVEQTSYVRWGSPSMFMLRYFRAKFAVEPTIIASYGKDFLQYAGDVTLLPKEPNLDHTIIFENIYVDGHRTLYCHHGDAILPAISDAIKKVLSEADIVFLAPLTPAYSVDYVAKLMASVPAKCLKVILPQGYFRYIDQDDLVCPREFSEAGDILPYFDLAVLSDEDHPQSETIARSWKKMSPNTNIIMTRNANGADIILPQGSTHVPTQPVPPEKIVDPVGLGDTFSAGAAYQLAMSGDLITAVKEGHAAALEKLLSPRVN